MNVFFHCGLLEYFCQLQDANVTTLKDKSKQKQKELTNETNGIVLSTF